MGQHLLPLEQLGAPARALRAFRRLLFSEVPEVEASPLLRELPRPEVVHHLYSRAPPQLESPHARSGLTPAQARHPGPASRGAGCGAGGWSAPTHLRPTDCIVGKDVGSIKTLAYGILNTLLHDGRPTLPHPRSTPCGWTATARRRPSSSFAPRWMRVRQRRAAPRATRSWLRSCAA